MKIDKQYCFIYILLKILILFPEFLPGQSTPVIQGYRDFNYGTTVNSTPMGEIPESKLWWHDNYWWASLWNDSLNSHTIHQYNFPTSSWRNTGVTIDDRSGSKSDVLSDGNKLFIASHIFSNTAQSASAANAARLYRYSYSNSDTSYSLDAGYPVLINSSKSNSLVLTKDTASRLWITWVDSGAIMINHSSGDDATWATPFSLPNQTDTTTWEDVSSIITFGDSIGIFWTNQSTENVHFAVHAAADSVHIWQEEDVVDNEDEDGGLEEIISDEINLAAYNGIVYSVVQSSEAEDEDPQIIVFRRNAANSWEHFTFGVGDDNHRQALAVIDTSGQKLHVFAGSRQSSIEYIYHKSAPLSTLSFPSGQGTSFIASASDIRINKISASKQLAGNQSGILIQANDQTTRNYLHNFLELTDKPVISDFFPARGPVGTVVTITGRNFSSVSNIQFNGVSVDSFTVVSPFEIITTVPNSAADGPVTLTNPNGQTSSEDIFTVNLPPFDLTTSVIGAGSISISPGSGSYMTPTDVAISAIPDSGYIFSAWTGDLSGTVNPDTIRMDDDKVVTAIFIEYEGEQVSYQETVTGSSSGSSTVSTDSALTRINDALYLAAITSKSPETVSMVSGLGLSWTLLKSQCSGRNHTAVEIWQAQGTPSADGIVTATFADAPGNAVIAVTRYAWVDPLNPIGNIISGNTNGEDGLCSGGVDSNAYAFPIAATDSGAVIYGAAALRNRFHSPGSGYTERIELAQGTGGSAATLAVQDYLSPTPDSLTFNGDISGNVDWAVAALEIRPGTAGAGLPLYSVNTSVSGEGSVSNTPSNSLYYQGTTVQLTASPAANYQFSHWSGDTSSTTNPISIPVNGDRNLIANFTNLPQYTMTVSTVDSGSVLLNPSGGTYFSGSSVVLTAEPDSNYQFLSWTGDLTGSENPDTVIVDSNIAITANFAELPQYNLTTSISAGNGSIHMDPPGGIYYSGTSVVLTAQPDSGYEFQDWTGDLSGSNISDTLIIDANKSVSANFQELPIYSLDTTIIGNGNIVLQPAGGSYYLGTEVVLDAVADSGFLFQNWGGDLTGFQSPDTVTMDSNIAITAVFQDTATIAYTITASVDSNGSISLLPDNPTYSYGDTVIVQAIPDSGYGLNAWHGDLIGNENPDTLIMDGHKVISATITELPQFTVTAISEGNGAVQLSPPGGIYYQGSTVIVTAIPDSGYRLLDWDDDLDGDDNPDTLFIDTSKTVTAEFIELPQYTLTIDTMGTGTITLQPPGGTYYQGTTVYLTAQSGPGHLFAGWQFGLNGQMNPDSLVISKDLNLKAAFVTVPQPRVNDGIWINQTEIDSLPASGLAWDSLLSEANRTIGIPNVSDQDDSLNVRIFAKALVYAKTGIATYRTDVINGIMNAIGTETGARVLAIGREIPAYVIAADLVNLPVYEDSLFRDWLTLLRSTVFDGSTIRETNDHRPNNWGLHAGAARIAISCYLGDSTEVARAALIFQGWLGERQRYSDFNYGDLWWQSDSTQPVGINPLGATLNGHNVDGVLPDEQRRAGTFSWPPPTTSYNYEGLQAAMSQAIMLHRLGYDVFLWSDQALLRAFQWLYQQANYPADADDRWLLHAVNHYYDENFRADIPTTPGRSFGYTDWYYGAHDSLTVSHTGSGRVNQVALGRDAQGDMRIELTADPSSEYNFDQWSGDLNSTINPDTVILDGNKTITALFSKGLDSSSVRVRVKVFLEGPFQTDSMQTNLANQGALPLSQPFNISPWNYDGTESVTAMADNVVDWVLVKLRTNSSANSEVAGIAALLTSDGDLMRADSAAALKFYGFSSGNYYITVYHRNHLPIMSPTSLFLSSTTSDYDFTNSQSSAYGSTPMVQLNDSIYGMVAGDGNKDFAVDSLDKQLNWRMHNATNWTYDKYSDFNLDNSIDVFDLNFIWRKNNGRSTTIPFNPPAGPANGNSLLPPSPPGEKAIMPSQQFYSPVRRE